MTMTLVETIEVGAGGAASIEFTSIPQDADDLLIVLSLRGGNTNANFDYANMTFNNTGAGFSQRYLQGSGSAVTSSTLGNGLLLRIPSSLTTSNTFGSQGVYVSNYAGSTNKSFSYDGVSENNATEAYQNVHAGLWSNTSAITTIKFVPNFSSTFVQYSTASLYKITKA